eukprot:PhM_4_TR4941/c0_g1_i1/m.30253
MQMDPTALQYHRCSSSTSSPKMMSAAMHTISFQDGAHTSSSELIHEDVEVLSRDLHKLWGDLRVPEHDRNEMESKIYRMQKHYEETGTIGNVASAIVDVPLLQAHLDELKRHKEITLSLLETIERREQALARLALADDPEVPQMLSEVQNYSIVVERNLQQWKETRPFRPSKFSWRGMDYEGKMATDSASYAMKVSAKSTRRGIPRLPINNNNNNNNNSTPVPSNITTNIGGTTSGNGAVTTTATVVNTNSLDFAASASAESGRRHNRRMSTRTPSAAAAAAGSRRKSIFSREKPADGQGQQQQPLTGSKHTLSGRHGSTSTSPRTNNLTNNNAESPTPGLYTGRPNAGLSLAEINLQEMEMGDGVVDRRATPRTPITPRDLEREEYLYQEYQRLKVQSAVTIQRHVRGYLRRCKVIRTACEVIMAQRIQRLFRRFLYRRRGRIYRRQVKAALRLQVFFRLYVHPKVVAASKSGQNAMTSTQNLAYMHRMARSPHWGGRQERRKIAARIMTKFMRWVVWVRNMERRVARRVGARTLQRLYRGYRARKMCVLSKIDWRLAAERIRAGGVEINCCENDNDDNRSNNNVPPPVVEQKDIEAVEEVHVETYVEVKTPFGVQRIRVDTSSSSSIVVAPPPPPPVAIQPQAQQPPVAPLYIVKECPVSAYDVTCRRVVKPGVFDHVDERPSCRIGNTWWRGDLESVVVLQRAWRCFAAKRRVSRLRRQREHKVALIECLQRVTHLALLVQTSLAARRSGRISQLILSSQYNEAQRRIRRTWLRHQRRRRPVLILTREDTLRCAPDARLQHEKESVRRISEWVLECRTQQRLRQARRARRRDRAAKRVQRSWRAFRIRQMCATERRRQIEAYHSWLEMRREAACCIQFVWRQYSRRLTERRTLRASNRLRCLEILRKAPPRRPDDGEDERRHPSEGYACRKLRAMFRSRSLGEDRPYNLPFVMRKKGETMQWDRKGW